MADADRLDEIKARAAAATPGPWKPTTDICDCGWDYACGHGSFIDGLELPDPKIERKNGAYESYDYLYSEFVDFSHGTRDFLVHSRADVDWLTAEVERLRTELAEAHTEAAKLAEPWSHCVCRSCKEEDGG